jgi:hypothetical protein
MQTALNAGNKCSTMVKLVHHLLECAMSTKKPRIHVTLEASDYAAVRRLSHVRGVTMSCVVAELVEAAVPILDQVSSTIEGAKRMDSGMKERFKAELDLADNKLTSMVESVVGQLDLLQEIFDEISHGNQEEGEAKPHLRRVQCELSDPRPVITGVTPPSTPYPSALKKSRKRTADAVLGQGSKK